MIYDRGKIVCEKSPSGEQRIVYPPGEQKITSALDTQVGGGHYKDLPIQPVKFNHANGIPYIEGCVIKYMVRWREKNGVQDLEKAKHYIDLLISLEVEENG